MAEHGGMVLYTDAYLADTTHLTTEEHGAYLLILMAMWRSPDKALPDDDAMLARYARLSPRRWKAIAPTIRALLSPFSENRVTQKRLRREAEYVAEKSAAQRAKAEQRWNGKPLKNNNTGDAAASPRHMPEASRDNAQTMPGPCPEDAPQPPTPTPTQNKRSTSVRPFVVSPAREAEPPPDRPPDGGLGRTDGDGLSDLSDRVMRAAGFDPARRNPRSDAWLREWRAKLNDDRIVAAVEARTEAMRATGDPPRTLRAFDHELGVQSQASADPKPFKFDRSLIR